MPRRTRREIELRLREVEHALLTYPWTLDTQGQLAERSGVSERQIREDARVVRERWAEDARLTKQDESKADWLQRLRMAQHQARKDKQTIALSRLMALEARAMGYEAPMQVHVQHTVEQLDPVSQAQAIVQYYPEAVRLLELAGETPTKVLEASYTDEGA
jgi:hypothetical protein